MFHCNGWCFTWGVTAVGGHARLPAPRRAGPDLGPDRRRGRHPLLRRAHRADRRRQRSQGRTRSTRPVTVRGGRRAALAHAARPAARSSASVRSTSTASPRPTARTPSARGTRSWDALPAEEQARLKAAPGRRATSSPTCVRVVDEHDAATCPRDGETLGEVVMRGNNVMKGYYEQPEATRRGVPRRLVPLRRPRGAGTPTATSSCGTARRTSSSRAARTSRPSRWSRRWPSTRPCWSARWSPSPTRSGASGRRRSSRSSRARRRTEAEIIEFCREHIAHFKCPAAIEFGDLPKTSTGKVQKFVLRDREWKGHGQAHQLSPCHEPRADAERHADPGDPRQGPADGRHRPHDQEPDHRAADRQGLLRPDRRRPRCWTSSAPTEVAAESAARVRQGRRARAVRRPSSSASRSTSSRGGCRKGLDEAALRALVRERLGALGITDAKQIGRLLGDLMKTHKGQIEAADVKRIAEELLSRRRDTPERPRRTVPQLARPARRRVSSVREPSGTATSSARG